MLDLDDLLQQKLTELENGQSLDDVIASLPLTATELIPLLQLAASVRTLPQPDLTQSQAEAGQRKVLEAARDLTVPSAVLNGRVQTPGAPGDRTQPAAVVRGAYPEPGGDATRPNRGPARSRMPSLNVLRSQPRFWMGALAGVFLVILLVIGGLVWFLSPPRGAEAATLMDVNGQVEVASSDRATDWKPLQNGETIDRGERIRTGDGSSATLVFYEGTRSTIGPNADLTLTNLSGGRGKLLRVLIDQYSGRTVNSVVPFSNKDSSFIVNTPSGSATVHGTLFDVEIGRAGQTRFAVTRGKVLVYNDQSQVFVNAGQAARVGVDDTISKPAYQFQLQGPVDAIDGSTWTVQGVSFVVSDQTNINGDFAIGSRVSVDGHLEDNARIADAVNPAGDSNNQAVFTGPIQSMDGDVWQIGGYPVTVNTDTQRPVDLRPGDPVSVTFRVENGKWIATKIDALRETNEDTTPVPTTTPNANANPQLVFEQEEVETTACGTDFNLNGVLTNTATGPNDNAADVQLGYLILRGGGYVNSAELVPSSWTTIQPGKSVNFTLHVVTPPDYKDTTGNDKQIKLRVFIANEANRPDQQNAQMTATIVSNCKQEETGTPQTTLTPSQTPLVTPTATLPGSATPLANTCTGANPHPEGMRLAQRYNVPYEEIMGWFCQNFGFGEIDLAYSLSQQSGKPVSEIFAMRRSGLGWGEIKKQLSENLKPGNDKNNDNKPGKGPKTKPTKKPKP